VPNAGTEDRGNGNHEPGGPPRTSLFGRISSHPLVRAQAARLKRMVTHNLYLKVLSFALALVLWARVSEDQMVTETVSVKLVVKRPRGLILLDPPGETMAIQVMSPRSKLKALQRAQLELHVDLSSATVGEMEYSPVGQRIRNLPTGVEITAYMPSTYHFTFDKEMTRTLKVRVPIEGEPAPGYHVVGRPLVEPPSVTLVGPASVVENLVDVATEPVDVSDLTDSHTGRYLLNLENPLLRVEGGREDVVVSIEIEPIRLERTFADLPVEIPETMGRCRLKPDRATVVLEGPSEVLGRIEPGDVRIFLQEGSMPPSELRRPHKLQYPPPERARGLPRITISWPNENVVKLKRVTPEVFEFRVLAEG